MRLFFLFFFFCTTAATAQDLTGIWRGHFISDNANRMMDSLGIQDRYKFEIQVDQDQKSFQGVTYSYKTTIFYGKASAIGTINKQTKKVLLQETKILEVKTTGGACIMTCFLQYSKVGSEEFLEGHYTGISIADSTFCGKGTVFLRKVPFSDFYKEPFLVEKEKTKKADPPVVKKNPAPPAAQNKTVTPPTARNKPAAPPAGQQRKPAAPSASKKPAAAKPQAPFIPNKSQDLKRIPEDSLRSMLGKANPAIPVPKVISSRKNEVVKTISTNANEVYVKIYDNGSIDNDTVSVYLDNKLVISRQRLTENAITVQIHLEAQTAVHELVMVAENLGEIPPNTSLMVVQAGEENYEVRITSTEQKNAVVLFRYAP